MYKSVTTFSVPENVPTQEEVDGMLSGLDNIPVKKKKSKSKFVVSSERVKRAPERDIYGNFSGISHVRKRSKALERNHETIKSIDHQPSAHLDLPEVALPLPDQSSTKPSQTSQYEEAVASLLGFLADVQAEEGFQTTQKKYVSHEERKRRSEVEWEQVRPILFSSIFKNLWKHTNPMECECSGDAVISCLDCKKRFCFLCDEAKHSKSAISWHNRRTFVHGYEKALEPCTVLNKTDSGIYVEEFTKERYVDFHQPEVCIHCNGVSFTPAPHYPCAFVTTKGRCNLYIPKFVCNACGKDSTVTLCDFMESKFWPGSPQISSGMYIFSFEVLELYHLLKMESPSLSRRTFLVSLEGMSKTNGCFDGLSPQPFRAAYHEWQYCHYAVEKISGAQWMDCPACYGNFHAVHLDGNRKLYRFTGQNQTSHGNHFGDIFIADDADVDAFVKKVRTCDPQKKANDSSCGDTHWKAARNTSKKQKTLQETGLEVGCCRHAVMLKALNMFQGEIFAYPLYLHQWLAAKGLTFVCQDVICKYWPWFDRMLRNMKDDDAVQKMKNTKPFLSVFHAKAHDWTCQVIWGGRWQTESAAQAGEEMEQANSYLSRAAFTTKTMHKSGREEQLTAHALYWNRKKISSIHLLISSRYRKALLKLEKLKKELSDALVTEGLCETVLLESWKTDVQEFAKAIKRARSTKKNVTSESSSTESNGTNLESIQKEIVLQASVVKRMKYECAKKTDSSKKRLRLRSAMEKEKTALSVTIALFNLKVESDQQIRADDATKEDYIFPWENIQGFSGISYSQMRKVVDINEHVKRYEEELVLLIKEMKNVVKFLREKIHALAVKIRDADNTPDRFAEEIVLHEDPYSLKNTNDKVVWGVIVSMKAWKAFYQDLLTKSIIAFKQTTDSSQVFDEALENDEDDEEDEDAVSSLQDIDVDDSEDDEGEEDECNPDDDIHCI